MNKKAGKNIFQKYLVYPIGEILLLVIGIYIAVQINNWNEGRNEELKAKKHLRALRSNLKANIINNDIFIKRFKENISKIEKTQEMLMLNPDTISDKTIINMMSFFGPLNGAVLYRSAYDNMMNDNSLQSIKNDTLKRGIFFLGTIYEYNEKQSIDYSKHWVDYMLPYMVKNGNFVHFSDSIPIENVAFKMKIINRNAFVNNIEFFNIVTLRAGYVGSYIRLFENENKVYESAIKRIERYLDIEPREKKEETSKNEEKNKELN